MIKITSNNESYAKLHAPPKIIKELVDVLAFRPNGYLFMPAFTSGLWDGWIYPLQKTGMFGKGLLLKICELLEERNLEYEINSNDFPQLYEPEIKLNLETIKLTDAAGNPIQPFDYQVKGVEWALENKRGIVLAPTGAGKSLIIFLLLRTLLESNHYKKILVLVPSISLTTQLYSDFNEYTQNDKDWNSQHWVHQISAGKDKESDMPAFISTWQSLTKIKDDNYFTQFDAVIVDEVHTAEAKSISNIVNKCTEARTKIGLTGTLKDCKTHITALTGLFGEQYRVTTTKELMERGVLTKLEVNAILLKHDEIPKLEYKDELDFIVLHQRRNKFIVSLTELHPNQNYLILYQFVEKHGKPLYDYIRQKYPEKQVILINGDISAKEREQARKITENNNNVIIVASYQTFQQGINIKNLHNVIFASPSKSSIRVFQSIGRALRKHKSKDVARLYDIADDLRGKRKTLNYTLAHFKERTHMYFSEDFKIKFKELKI